MLTTIISNYICKLTKNKQLKYMIQLLKGDCLIESDKIESGSVDLILTDLPYGTMKGRDYSKQPNQKEGSKTAQDHNWDETLPTKKVFEIAKKRINEKPNTLF